MVRNIVSFLTDDVCSSENLRFDRQIYGAIGLGVAAAALINVLALSNVCLLLLAPLFPLSLTYS